MKRDDAPLTPEEEEAVRRQGEYIAWQRGVTGGLAGDPVPGEEDLEDD